MEDRATISSAALPSMPTLQSRSSSSPAVSETSSQLSSRHTSPGPASPAVVCEDSQALAKSLRDLELSKENKEQMFSSLGAIFQRAEAEGVGDFGELGVIFEHADRISRAGHRDVDALRNVKNILHQMWWSNSDFMTQAAQVLADASRDRMLFNPS